MASGHDGAAPDHPEPASVPVRACPYIGVLIYVPGSGGGACMRVARRIERLVGETPPIAAAHFRAESRPYHPVDDPDGYLNLGTAENRLVWDLLAPLMTSARPVSAADTRYAPLHGTAALRE